MIATRAKSETHYAHWELTNDIAPGTSPLLISTNVMGRTDSILDSKRCALRTEWWNFTLHMAKSGHVVIELIPDGSGITTHPQRTGGERGNNNSRYPRRVRFGGTSFSATK